MLKFKRAIKKIITALVKYMRLIFSQNILLVNFYYLIFFQAFYREKRAVLHGIIRYNKDKADSSIASSALLRKNIHGLEKGLIMRPPKKAYALRYIQETVDMFEKKVASINEGELLTCELQWAYDVMKEYFENCDKDNIIIKRARSKFNKLLSNYDFAKKTPYIRGIKQHLLVSYENLYDLSIRRRSVRWYLQKKVDRQLIDRALEVAKLAPSACNRQPFKYLILDDKALIQKIAILPFGTKGFYDNIPNLAVVVGQLNAYSGERDRHLIHVDASLSAMSFLYALETLGISSCVLNWPDAGTIDKKVRRIIDLCRHEQIIMLIAFGYPDPEGLIPYSQKKTIEQIRDYI